MNYKLRKLQRKNSYKKIKNTEVKLKRILKQLTFEETITFLQLELLKSIEEKEKKREDIEMRKDLIMAVNQKIKKLSKENFYLRDRNFANKKKFERYQGKIKTLKAARKETKKIRVDLEKEVEALSNELETNRNFLQRKGIIDHYPISNGSDDENMSVSTINILNSDKKDRKDIFEAEEILKYSQRMSPWKTERTIENFSSKVNAFDLERRMKNLNNFSSFDNFDKIDQISTSRIKPARIKIKDSENKMNKKIAKKLYDLLLLERAMKGVFLEKMKREKKMNRKISRLHSPNSSEEMEKETRLKLMSIGETQDVFKIRNNMKIEKNIAESDDEEILTEAITKYIQEDILPVSKNSHDFCLRTEEAKNLKRKLTMIKNRLMRKMRKNEKGEEGNSTVR